MRFKARLAMEQVQLLHNLVGPTSKLNPSSSSSSPESLLSHGGIGAGGGVYFGGGSVFHIDPERLRISTRGSGGGGTSTASTTMATDRSNVGSGVDGEGIACFIELATRGGIFLDHRIESAANNVIVFEMDLGQLRVALGSILSSSSFGSAFKKRRGGRESLGAAAPPLYNSSTGEGGGEVDLHPLTFGATTAGGAGGPAGSYAVVMKLAKRNGGIPCLCLDAPGEGGKSSVEVHHAIPVRIMRAVEMQYHLPPRISMPDVQLELPPDRPLKSVVERLKFISPQVFLDGSMAGELTLRVDGEGASIRTFYSKLVPRFEDCKTPEDSNNNVSQEPARCTVKVDSKKLHACLQWQASMVMGRSVGPAVLCMVENEMLVLHVGLNPANVGFFTYYVPVHFLSADALG